MRIKQQFIIEPTADGTQTLRHPLLDDLYHSENGAVSESEHVFIRNGLHFLLGGGHRAETVNILEAGFGSGLNALLTLREAEKTGIHAHYTAVELYPLPVETALSMDYAIDPAFILLHKAPWDGQEKISAFFTIKKIEVDLAEARFDTIFDLVYFDAFSPTTQPELWTPEIFGRIYAAMNKGGILVTYSAKGDVKRALRDAGFEVSRLPGAPGKRHMLRAVKT